MTLGHSLICLVIACHASAAHEIQNVVVAMLENRAFDHMLGFMKRGGPFGDTRVNGLTGKECNAKDLSRPSGDEICVNDEAQDHCAYDPNHSFAATTERILTGAQTRLSTPILLSFRLFSSSQRSEVEPL